MHYKVTSCCQSKKNQPTIKFELRGSNSKLSFKQWQKKRVLQRKTTLCHVLSAFCGCGTAIDSQTLLKRGWLIYLLQIVVGEKTYHITSWSYFPSPPLASASEPGAGGKGSQRARSTQPGPSRGWREPRRDKRPVGGCSQHQRKGRWGQGLHVNARNGNGPAFKFPEGLTGKVLQ